MKKLLLLLAVLTLHASRSHAVTTNSIASRTLISSNAAAADATFIYSGGSTKKITIQKLVDSIGALGVPTNRAEFLISTNPIATPSFGIFAGDSLTTGYLSVSNYSMWLTNTYGYSFDGSTNTAIDGQNSASIQTLFTTQIGQFTKGAGTNVVLFLWAGVNDLQSGTAEQVFARLTNIWQRAQSSNMTVVAFTVTSFNEMTDLQQANRYRLNAMIRNSSHLWDYLVDVAAFIPSIKKKYWYVDTVHLTSDAHKFIAYNVAEVLKRPRHLNTTKIEDEFYPQTLSLSPADYIGHRGWTASILSRGGYPGLMLDNTNAAISIMPYNSEIQFHGKVGTGNFATSNVFMIVNAAGVVFPTNNVFFGQSVSATNGYLMPSNTWNLATVTNGMSNGGYKLANSNGTDLVSVFMSNGVAVIKTLAP